MIFFLLLNILLCYFIALKLGKTRKIGFWPCFIAGLFLTPLGGVIIALLTPSLENNNHSRKIIITGGGQSEMREFVRNMFKKLESEIRRNESYLSNAQIRERIIEIIYNVSQDLLYTDISKFQIKYKISASEAKQVIDEEISRHIIMLN